MNSKSPFSPLYPVLAGVCLLLGTVSSHAQSAWLPASGRVVVGTQYIFETYRELFGAKRQPIRLGDDVDQHTFQLTGQYGLDANWALDATIGFVSVDTAAFGKSISTDSGLADSRLGIRHCLVNEFETSAEWAPTVTLRLGGIAAGTYNYLSLAGDGAYGFESSVMVGKTLPQWGVGVHSELGYRVRDNPVPDEYYAVLGVFKRIDEVVLSAGVRHTQAVSGESLGQGRLFWPRHKEVVDQFEAGIGLLDGPRTYQIFSAYAFDGKNTGRRLVVGVGVNWGF
jgi:hypothetical protein